jgi:hypothetical protein
MPAPAAWSTWRFARYHHDIQAINAMIERAEAVATGKRPLKRDRFVKVIDADPVVDWDLVERARYAAGLKGYVPTSTPTPSPVSRSWPVGARNLVHCG